MPEDTLRLRIARRYDVSLQVASFFALLILSEGITEQALRNTMGEVDIHNLVYRLRRALEHRGKTADIIKSRRAVGYWLDFDVRMALAAEFGIEIA